MDCITRETKKVRFFYGPDKILRTECFPRTVMTLSDGIESTRISAEILEYVPQPLLCDLTNVIRMTHDCRKHFASDEHAATFTKAALIVGNPVSRIIGNFFLGLNKPKKPTRIFNSIEDGINWLNSTF